MQTAYHCSNYYYYYYYYYYYIEKLTSSYSDTLNAIYKTRILNTPKKGWGRETLK